MLLWDKYVNQGSTGWVDLNPVTIIFMPDESEVDMTERLRHAIVMDVPGGANLRFDRPLDLTKGGIGRLIEGKLRGQVTIWSKGKRPDHQDDLLAHTSDVHLNEQRITTDSHVDFQWGRNSGSGRQMEIKLYPLGPREGNQDGPNIGGIEQFELTHVERMHMDMGSAASATARPGSPQAPTNSPPGLGGLSAQGGPVEITCRGPFRFNLVEREPVATFRDQVDVLRIQPNGPSDHMSSELLSIFFTRAATIAGAGPPNQGAPGSDLKPARIEAVGTPTVLEATMEHPADHLHVRAERLQYNLIDGQIYLQDSQEATLLTDRDEIHTPSLRYVPGPPNHTGQFQLLASGPGRLRGEMADRPGQKLDAHWLDKLEVRPQDKDQVISLHGEATLDFQAMGRLDAQDIHFWMHESPQDAASGKGYQPDRLLAEGNVVGASPQFSAKVDRLEVWFSSPPPAVPASGGPGLAAGGPALAYVPSTAGPSPPSPLAGMPGGAPAAPGERQSHLEINGRLLQARVILQDQQHGDLTEVTVVDHVNLRETQTAAPGDLPLVVTGQWLHATEASSPQAKVTVTGEPAHMEGRGMSLTGPNIHIDRGANVLSMEGPGQMDKLLDRDLENRPLSQAGTVRINWQKGMRFDGLKAHFQDSVNVISEAKLLQTGSLDVCFQHPISFSDARQQQAPPLVESFICGDGVFFENRSFEAGRQMSYDRGQLKNLDLNNITGDFHGDGPGWVVSVRHGGQGFAMPGGPLAGPGCPAAARPVGFNPAQPPPADPNALTCVRLRFMRGITGNKIHKDLVFHGQVHAAYGPAQNWATTLDSDDPEVLGPEAVVLRCESLQVNDMSSDFGQQQRQSGTASLGERDR